MKREEALALWNQVKQENPFEACYLKAYEAEHLNDLIVAFENKLAQSYEAKSKVLFKTLGKVVNGT